MDRRYQATAGDSRRLSSLVNGTLSNAERRPATPRIRLTGEGSLVRTQLRPVVFTFHQCPCLRLGLTFCGCDRCRLGVMPLAGWLLPVRAVQGGMSCSPCRVFVMPAVLAMTAGCGIRAVRWWRRGSCGAGGGSWVAGRLRRGGRRRPGGRSRLSGCAGCGRLAGRRARA